MKHKSFLLLFLSIAFAVGCDKQQTTSQQIDKLKTETKAAAQELQEQDYTYAQKKEFTEKMQGQLAEITRELNQLEAKLDKTSDAIKAETKPKLRALRDQEAQLNKQLDEIKNATESNWDSAKVASKKAFNDLKDGFQSARQWVSEKIAP